MTTDRDGYRPRGSNLPPDAHKAHLLGEAQKIDMSTSSGESDPHDIYDHEIVEISNLLEQLYAESKGVRDRGRWDQDVVERFAEIGFDVSVSWWTTTTPDVLMPEITINGRIDPHEFDHDRQVHEVVHDTLGTGDRGYVREDGTIKDPSTSVGGFEKPSDN